MLQRHATLLSSAAKRPKFFESAMTQSQTVAYDIPPIPLVYALAGRDAPAPQRCFVCDKSPMDASRAALVRLSARFSLSDLPDFLLIVCRGDLSDIMAPSYGAWLVPGSVDDTPRRGERKALWAARKPF